MNLPFELQYLDSFMAGKGRNPPCKGITSRLTLKTPSFILNTPNEHEKKE